MLCLRRLRSRGKQREGAQSIPSSPAITLTPPTSYRPTNANKGPQRKHRQCFGWTSGRRGAHANVLPSQLARHREDPRDQGFPGILGKRGSGRNGRRSHRAVHSQVCQTLAPTRADAHISGGSVFSHSSGTRERIPGLVICLWNASGSMSLDAVALDHAHSSVTHLLPSQVCDPAGHSCDTMTMTPSFPNGASSLLSANPRSARPSRSAPAGSSLLAMAPTCA